MRLGGITALGFAVSVLGGCSGGGGGGNTPAPPPVTVSGTVATNTPADQQNVFVVSPTNQASGGFTAASMSGPDGRYSVTSSPSLSAPFFITANGVLLDLGGLIGSSEQQQYPRLTSFSYRASPANVTPLTSLLVARLLNRKPDPADIQSALDLRARSETDIKAAEQQVLAYLMNRPNKDNGNATTPVDVSAVTDFVSMPLNAAPGDPYFEALKRLHESLMDSETIQGVEEHMLFGTDAPADLRALLSLDFLANCALQSGGMDDGTLPRGVSRVTLDRREISVGSAELAFQTGDELEVDAPQSFESTWTFRFTASQTDVRLSARAGRLHSVVLSVPGKGSSECQPQSELLLAGKLPSLMALIRLFAQSLSSHTFQCTVVTAQGFLVGSNELVVETNGAFRINPPSGPALHVPSLDLHIQATLTVAAGEVQPSKPSFFHAVRVFGVIGMDNSGVYDFRANLNGAGQITGLELMSTGSASSRLQRCG